MIDRAQAQERDLKINDILDEFENALRDALAEGAEPQVRTRLLRYMPDLKSPPAGDAAPANTALDAMELANVLTACRQLSGWRLTAAQHHAVQVIRVWVTNRLTQAAKGDIQ